MKVSEEAKIKAREKKQNDKDLLTCLNNLVCPKCAGDLKSGVFPSYNYKCRECTFGFTSAEETELQRRIEYDK